MPQAPLPEFSRQALQNAQTGEARGRSRWSPALRWLYRKRRFRSLALRLCNRLEGGVFYSQTLRQILRDTHRVDVGKYSYGDILKPGLLPPGTEVGAYCSVGAGLIVRRRDHPIERPFLHPFFYNHKLGLLDQDTIQTDAENPLVIGHDVWIADRVTILSGCRHIGTGAVLAAGAIVTKNVPAYSIVGGVPAKVLKMRFSEDDIQNIERSKWWEKDIEEIIALSPDRKIPCHASDLTNDA